MWLDFLYFFPRHNFLSFWVNILKPLPVFSVNIYQSRPSALFSHLRVSSIYFFMTKYFFTAKNAFGKVPLASRWHPNPKNGKRALQSLVFKMLPMETFMLYDAITTLLFSFSMFHSLPHFFSSKTSLRVFCCLTLRLWLAIKKILSSATHLLSAINQMTNRFHSHQIFSQLLVPFPSVMIHFLPWMISHNQIPCFLPISQIFLVSS